MKQLPTPRTPSPSAAVMRAITSIELAKQDAEPPVAEFLDYVGQLIAQRGDPTAVLDSVSDALAREEIRALGNSYCLTLHTTRAADQPTELHVVWNATGGLVIVPQALGPRLVLTKLRAAIAELEEEERLSADFQASVAAGYVEDVDTWFSRTQADR
ncbi:hypothetical protein ACFYQA_02280 [Streptomyces sp. NPDC005774]|uniref:hypothetical protein n=1 Tax=Streptomyces sp. NPDC005774 TaxID=3364728 RepID=UPI003673FC07